MGRDVCAPKDGWREKSERHQGTGCEGVRVSSFWLDGQVQITLGTWFLPLPDVTLENAGEVRGVGQQCWGESIPSYSQSVTSGRTADLAVEIVTEE